MIRMKYKDSMRKKRALRRRKKCQGTALRPRLSIFRSLNHMCGQLIDDDAHKTLCTLSSQNSDVKKEIKDKQTKTETAQLLGERFGEQSKKLGVERVKCDIGPYKFHGRIKAFVEGFQKSGIKL